MQAEGVDCSAKIIRIARVFSEDGTLDEPKEGARQARRSWYFLWVAAPAVRYDQNCKVSFFPFSWEENFHSWLRSSEGSTHVPLPG